MNRTHLLSSLFAAAVLAVLPACADLSVATDASTAGSPDTRPYQNAANPLGAESKVNPLSPSPG
jgi:hypothetical protein